jgi:streptogramin lyase
MGEIRNKTTASGDKVGATSAKKSARTKPAKRTTNDPPTRPTSSILSAYTPRAFIKTKGAAGVAAILRGNGGSYALAGPRGSGKSWAMLQAREYAIGNGGLGLWFPSPSEYEPLSFVLSLTDAYCTELSRRLRSRLKATIRRRITYLIVFVILFAYVAENYTLTRNLLSADGLSDFLSAFLYVAILGALFFVAITSTLRALQEIPASSRLIHEAEAVREAAQYSAKLSATGEAQYSPKLPLIGFTLKRSRSRELTERPLTLSGMTNRLRALIADSALILPGPVLILIDELDKMSDTDRVKQLLRDIKGLFEVPMVTVFVSISEEAARSLALGPVRGRDEFNSSFYAVVHFGELRRYQCAELLSKRHWVPTDEVLDLLVVASGGLPRDFVRLSDLLCFAEAQNNDRISKAATYRFLVSEACRGFHAEWALGPVLSLVSSDNASDLMKHISVLASLRPADVKAYIEAKWDYISGGTDGRELEEEWRRLLCQIAALAKVAEGDGPSDDELVERCRIAVAASTRSSASGSLALSDTSYAEFILDGGFVGQRVPAAAVNLDGSSRREAEDAAGEEPLAIQEADVNDGGIESITISDLAHRNRSGLLLPKMSASQLSRIAIATAIAIISVVGVAVFITKVGGEGGLVAGDPVNKFHLSSIIEGEVGSVPGAITAAGADVWLVDPRQNSVLRLSANLRQVKRIRVGDGVARGLLVTPNGTTLVSEDLNDSVAIVSGEEPQVHGSIQVAGTPRLLVGDAAGSWVWTQSDLCLRHLDLRNRTAGTCTKTGVQEPLLVSGADQKVYVIDTVLGRLREFDPKKGRLGASVKLAIDIANVTDEPLVKQAFFADGALWLLTQNGLYRINARTFKTAGPVTLSLSDPAMRRFSWASVDSAGDIWAIGGGSLVHVDAKSRSVSKQIMDFYDDSSPEEKLAVSTSMVCVAGSSRFRCFDRSALEALLK